MFENFRNIPITLNNNELVISEGEISQEIGLTSPYKYDERVSDRYLPNSIYEGSLRLKYFITGNDFLINYLYSNEVQTLTGNFAGLTFSQGYLNNYSINLIPNSPAEANVNILFYDKISGTFTTSPPKNTRGTILNLYNAQINNLSNYTENTLTNLSQVNFSYNCQINPSYKFYDTGLEPTRADRVSIGERTLTTEIISDNTTLSIPLSGEKFGLTITLVNPSNTGINQSFGCSGRINSKTLNIQAGNLHTHQIRVQQNHLNHFGNIGSVVVATGAGIFTIYSQDGYKAFASNDAQLKYIDKIMVGDTLCPDYTYFDAFGSNGLIVTTPASITDDILTVYTTRGNLVWPNVLTFSYSGITITGLSMWSGFPGSIINITGTNFYRISDVYFGNQRATFQTVSSGLIQAVVPYNGTTHPIQIMSSKRNLTGISNRLFFCRPEITSATPLTGVWKDNITIGGLNFSGTTGVTFGNVNANSFTVLSNVIITAQTPETGAGFPTGYIYIYGSGGSAKSYSRYNPHVPIYSYDPISGVWGEPVNIRTKVDTGYYYPLSGGYKIKFGNVDTVFYPSGYESNSNNKTGCLTGLIPDNAQDDYIFIYQPDGVSTYSPNSLKFNVISEPQIYSFAPSLIRRYQFFTPVLNGKNFKYFSQKPYYFALSGGSGNNVQFYTNIVSNSGGAADTMYIPAILITGHTGIYSAIVQNQAGQAVFSGALQVLSGINQAKLGGGTVATTTSVKSNKFAKYANDGSLDTFAAVNCTATNYANYLQLTAKNLMDVSLVQVEMNNLPTLDGEIPHQSGKISLYEKNAASAIFSIQDYSSISGIAFATLRSLTNPGEFGGYTGIKTIRIFTPSGGASVTHYLGVSEVNIY